MIPSGHPLYRTEPLNQSKVPSRPNASSAPCQPRSIEKSASNPLAFTTTAVPDKLSAGIYSSKRKPASQSSPERSPPAPSTVFTRSPMVRDRTGRTQDAGPVNGPLSLPHRYPRKSNRSNNGQSSPPFRPVTGAEPVSESIPGTQTRHEPGEEPGLEQAQ